MKTIKLYILFILSLISQISCASSLDVSDIISRCKLSEEIETIVNDEFLTTVINKDLAFERVSNAYPSANVNSIEVASRHDPSIKNKLVVMDSGSDFFSYYLSGDNKIPVCIVAETGKIKFNSGVEVGQSSSEVKKIFNIKKELQAFAVGNLEGGIKIRFYFDNGKVNKIVYSAEYID